MSTIIVQPYDRMNNMQPWNIIYERAYKKQSRCVEKSILKI